MFHIIRGAAVPVIVAISACAATIPAVAAPSSDDRSAAVSYRDIDLRTEQGVARLNRRIHVALTRVCGDTGTRDLAARSRIETCRRTALDSTRPTVALAVAAARGGQQLAQNTAPAIRIDAR